MFLKNGTIKSAFGGKFIASPLSTHAANRLQACAALAVGIAKARYTAANNPIADCQKYFSRAARPFGLRCTTLR